MLLPSVLCDALGHHHHQAPPQTTPTLTITTTTSTTMHRLPPPVLRPSREPGSAIQEQPQPPFRFDCSVSSETIAAAPTTPPPTPDHQHHQRPPQQPQQAHDNGTIHSAPSATHQSTSTSMYSTSTASRAPSAASTAHNQQPQQGPQGFSPLVDPSAFEVDGNSNNTRRGRRRLPGRGPPPPKTTLAAVLMLVTGTILLSVGLGIRWHTDPKEKERGLAMIILGSICTYVGGLEWVGGCGGLVRSFIHKRSWYASLCPTYFVGSDALPLVQIGRFSSIHPFIAILSFFQSIHYPTHPPPHTPTVFIPGSYASFQLYGAWAGWPGYSYAYIPSYDD